jgi:hypothetical protein
MQRARLALCLLGFLIGPAAFTCAGADSLVGIWSLQGSTNQTIEFKSDGSFESHHVLQLGQPMQFRFPVGSSGGVDIIDIPARQQDFRLKGTYKASDSYHLILSVPSLQTNWTVTWWMHGGELWLPDFPTHSTGTNAYQRLSAQMPDQRIQ